MQLIGSTHSNCVVLIKLYTQNTGRLAVVKRSEASRQTGNVRLWSSESGRTDYGEDQLNHGVKWMETSRKDDQLKSSQKVCGDCEKGKHSALLGCRSAAWDDGIVVVAIPLFRGGVVTSIPF